MQEFIDKIKYGNKEEATIATKNIGNFWQGILKEYSESEKSKFKIFFDEMEKFESIPKLENQIYFINCLQIPIWVLGDRYFKTVCNFILKYIEHPSGKIRQKILRLASWFSMIGLECVDGESRYDKVLNKEEIKLLSKNKEFYFELIEKLEKLLEKHYNPRFDKYEHIDELPASVYKSLEYLISNELLRVPKYEILYIEYKNKKNGYNTPKDILAKRNEIEKELTDLLNKTGSDFDMDDIKEIIFDEDGADDMSDIIRMFDNGDIDNLSTVLEIVSDAWNYFPHKILNGLSPEEKLNNG